MKNLNNSFCYTIVNLCLKRVQLSTFFLLLCLSTPCFGAEKSENTSIFCNDKPPLPKPVAQVPLSERSPQENVDAHDIVILGEVLVPPKQCSIGICAGVRVHQVVKGTLLTNSVVSASIPENLLIRIKTNNKHPATGQDCISEDVLLKKGQYWYIFAHAGTSKRGFIFYEIASDGPSFPTRAPIDFTKLEQYYQKYKKELDYAIKSTLGLSTSKQ